MMTSITDIANVSTVIILSQDVSHETVQNRDPILSDEAHRVLVIIFYSTLGGLVGVVGSAVNVINIVVFVKQGFSDSMSISLCALAVSDLGFLLMMVCISITTNPLLENADIGFDLEEFHHLTGALKHSCLVRITGLITAFITFERCVCVALPLKVKNIITPKRTLVSMIFIFTFIFAANTPTYSAMYLASSFTIKKNRTLISLKTTSNFQAFDNIASSFNIFVQVSSFTIVITCTVILAIKLLAKFKWRSKGISLSDVSDSIIIRDKRVIKMVTIISVIFIICYLPSAVNLVLMACLSPEYSGRGQYVYSFQMSWEIISTIEGINSSVTILVYYNMSSKFRETFNRLLSAIKNAPLKR